MGGRRSGMGVGPAMTFTTGCQPLYWAMCQTIAKQPAQKQGDALPTLRHCPREGDKHPPSDDPMVVAWMGWMEL